jgi:hypothetical protein
MLQEIPGQKTKKTADKKPALTAQTQLFPPPRKRLHTPGAASGEICNGA